MKEEAIKHFEDKYGCRWKDKDNEIVIENLGTWQNAKEVTLSIYPKYAYNDKLANGFADLYINDIAIDYGGEADEIIKFSLQMIEDLLAIIHLYYLGDKENETN